MRLSDFTDVQPIQKGWSSDRKFRVTRPDGSLCLLRTAPAGQYERKKAEYEWMERVAALSVPISRPLEFGLCGEEVCTLLTWVEGEDAEPAVARMSGKEAVAYGRTAGEYLRRIHTLPAPAEQEDWEPRMGRKIDRKIAMYRGCPEQFDGAEDMIAYLQANRSLLAGRPQCFQHGDYHVGNLMMENGRLVVIDFNRFDFGDPWEEFNRIVWCAQISPPFASGMVDGYFGGEPPRLFWRLLALYIASNTLSSLPWAVAFGQAEIDTMRNQAREVLSWYDGMTRVVPRWYSRTEAGR